jgi:hypothetical protein
MSPAFAAMDSLALGLKQRHSRVSTLAQKKGSVVVSFEVVALEFQE